MQNEYDNENFFQEYAKMSRSQGGLQAAGEWHQLKNLFPSLHGKKVLDLGCGYGWHCKYAEEQGAAQVLGIDLSRKMIVDAKRRNAGNHIEYRVCNIEEYDYPEDTWDFVISNLFYSRKTENPLFRMYLRETASYAYPDFDEPSGQWI